LKIAFIGIGQVGSALALWLVEAGHDVTIAARDPGSESVRAAQARTPALKIKPMIEAVVEAEVVFLATPFSAVEAALESAGDLPGKVVVDSTNPIGRGLLLAGNDQAAKETVGVLCEQLGWEPVDTGNISMSLHLEHMTLLWIKMARVQGRGAGLVWARLRR
jgi:predicted dinucleotide-binding enzyme